MNYTYSRARGAFDTTALEEFFRDKCLWVKCGGSWNNNASNLRSANRNNNTPSNRNNDIGFRLANSFPQSGAIRVVYGWSGGAPGMTRPVSGARGSGRVPKREEPAAQVGAFGLSTAPSASRQTIPWWPEVRGRKTGRRGLE